MQVLFSSFIICVRVCVCACTHVLTQSLPIHVTPMDCSPSGSSVHEIFQAEILEQIAISYSEGPF